MEKHKKKMEEISTINYHSTKIFQFNVFRYQEVIRITFYFFFFCTYVLTFNDRLSKSPSNLFLCTSISFILLLWSRYLLCMYVCVLVRVSVCVCVCKCLCGRERECECECVCMCEIEREFVCVCGRESVRVGECVSGIEWDWDWVCLWERKRERACDSVCVCDSLTSLCSPISIRMP